MGLFQWEAQYRKYCSGLSNTDCIMQLASCNLHVKTLLEVQEGGRAMPRPMLLTRQHACKPRKQRIVGLPIDGISFLHIYSLIGYLALVLAWLTRTYKVEHHRLDHEHTSPLASGSQRDRCKRLSTFCSSLPVSIWGLGAVCIDLVCRCGLYERSKAHLRDNGLRQDLKPTLAKITCKSGKLARLIRSFVIRLRGTTAAQSPLDTDVKSGVQLQLNR